MTRFFCSKTILCFVVFFFCFVLFFIFFFFFFFFFEIVRQGNTHLIAKFNKTDLEWVILERGKSCSNRIN